jgi:DNA-binding CsgD family transcriptional regulator
MVAQQITSTLLEYAAESKPIKAGAVRSREPVRTGELLRWLAEEADMREGKPSELRQVWPELLSGRLAVADAFYSPERWFIVLRKTLSPQPVPERDRVLLERSLLEDSQKRAALDAGLTASTLSMTIQRTLHLLGVPASASKAPPTLALLARAHDGAALLGRVSSLRLGPECFTVISVERPERRLASRLSPAEHQVLLRIVEGWSYAQIALERRTSKRTIANQIASAFHRLNVSGRAQLIGFLIERCVADEAAPVQPPTPSFQLGI